MSVFYLSEKSGTVKKETEKNDRGSLQKERYVNLWGKTCSGKKEPTAGPYEENKGVNYLESNKFRHSADRRGKNKIQNGKNNGKI